MKDKRINNITFGLFDYPRRYWYMNLRDLKYLPHRIYFTLTHGYSPAAQFDTDNWFIDVMREILNNHRYHRVGTQIIIDDYKINDEESDAKNENAYNKLFDEMIELLDLMEEGNPVYDKYRDNDELEKVYTEMNAAKDRFFKLFSEHFYEFWD